MKSNFFAYSLLFFWLLSIASTLPAHGQNNAVNVVNNINLPKKKPHKLPIGKFLADSIGIGLRVAYSLSYEHSPEQTILFPDTTYQYAPFELVERIYFPTRTQQNKSIDSVVYYFTTFEAQEVLHLQLPVFVIQGQDSLPLLPAKDSVFLQELVKGNLRTKTLKEQAAYVASEELFDYPMLITLISTSILVVLFVWLLVGQRLRKSLILYQFSIKHNRFLREYTRLVNRITEKKSAEDIEKAINIWKKHLEYIEERPFSTYTSKEIAQVIPDNRLSASLKSIDRAIYGKELTEEIESSLQFLKSFSVFRFERKQEALRLGVRNAGT